ncbi:hypothetical protein VTI74DRAFT_9808 [Chaetomium olivicolor]
MAFRLPELPDDILFVVFAHLESARDLRALAISCRRFEKLIISDGWRTFVKNRFPSLTIPSPATGSHTWQQLAESTTWQSRAWERRSLQFQVLFPHDGSNRNARTFPSRNGGLFMSVVDAHFNPATKEELVVWGAGEDIVARYRQRQGRGKASRTSWCRIDGKELGLSVGYDDVKTIKIIERGNGRAIIAGRHNGQLSLLSAEPDSFGECIARFRPIPDDTTQKSELETINSLDILDIGSNGLLAAATKSTLRIYSLPQGDVVETEPLAAYNLRESDVISSSERLGSARWMQQGESMALAVMGSKDALRYLSITPSGWSHHVAAKSERVEREFDVKYDRTISPNSLEPVYMHSGARRDTSLLLSSWKDGTIRLQDLRTPSPFDAIYQDNVDPWSNAETLMAYGTERFIAGAASGPTVQIFDFRWTKGYYHTSGLPCLDRSPFPRPSQPFMTAPNDLPTGRAHCDHTKGQRCHWHQLSRGLYFRPNAKCYLSDSLRTYRPNSVWSLARASDISPNFYIGISGGVIEATLEQTPETYPPTQPTVDPNFGFEDWRSVAKPACGYKAKMLLPSLMETGDGYSFKGNDRSILLPGLLRYEGPRELPRSQARLSKYHRLDIGYQRADDFAQDSD